MLTKLLKTFRQAQAHRQSLTILRTFFSAYYQKHNLARLVHLRSLGLEIQGKRVLEIGAGVGDHTLFYLYQGCTILPTDGRPELVAFLQQRLGVEARVLDVDTEPQSLKKLGTFDILHCYGLLYHLAHPESFLANAAEVTDMLFLETCLTHPSRRQTETTADAALVAENPQDPSQALHSIGCRPTREWVFDTLRKYFPYVYCPRTQPQHPEFPLSWEATDCLKTALTRAVFIASHKPIQNKMLVEKLPDRYDQSNSTGSVHKRSGGISAGAI
jgi:hypothetical protein